MVPDTGHPIDQQATPAHRHADASCSRRTKVIPFSLKPQSVWVGTKCQGICDRQSYSVLFEAGVDVATGVAPAQYDRLDTIERIFKPVETAGNGWSFSAVAYGGVKAATPQATTIAIAEAIGAATGAFVAPPMARGLA